MLVDVLTPNVLSIKANTLIDKDCLADFGLLIIIVASSFMVARGTTRWMSPELLNQGQFESNDRRPKKESDYYELGAVTYEALSSKTPFAPWKGFIVMWKVLEGEHPKVPEGEEAA